MHKVDAARIHALPNSTPVLYSLEKSIRKVAICWLTTELFLLPYFTCDKNVHEVDCDLLLVSESILLPYFTRKKNIH